LETGFGNYMMLIAVLLGGMLSLFLVIFKDYLRDGFSAFFFLVPLVVFTYFAVFFGSEVPALGLVSWQQGMGVHFEWRVDGLSRMFALLISGIGTLVFAYSHYYLKGHPEKFRFFGFLSLFMTAMLGLVVSDNLIMLFMFWELTSVSSFFLIGFHYEDRESRKAALRALTITGLGGVGLLIAAVLISTVTGSFSFQALLDQRETVLASQAGRIAFWLLILAAFTKSAQFPFHFWLPGAMKAPTPVSTYLHSATMVKAGVFLLLKLYPIYSALPVWKPLLMTVGGVSMVYSAAQALFFTDMKSILAYTTLSTLGILVFLTGIGGNEGLLAAAAFILVHALYKAALFLVTGIVDHEAHTRDVTALHGLRHVMPGVAVAGAVAALSHGGVPLTFGFIGKELMYESALHAETSPVPIAAAFVTGLLLFAAGFWVGFKPFFSGREASHTLKHPVSLWLQLPVYVLTAGTLIFGIWPAGAEQMVHALVEAAGRDTMKVHLELWHGFNTVFFLSLATIAGGIVLYSRLVPGQSIALKVEKLSYSSVAIYEKFLSVTKWLSRWYTDILQNGYLRWYVMTIMVFLLTLVGYSFYHGVHIYIDFKKISEVTLYEAVILLLMIFSIFYILLAKSRLAAVAAMGVLGISISLMFVLYSAPDLAMTQFSIDTLTVILFVLVLYKLPRYINISSNVVKIRDAVISLLFGLMITVLCLEVINEPVNREISEFYAENSYLLAKGKNVVNVILVDFRGADTMVEITVLTIAALGVFGLMKLRLKDNEKTWE
jgi:multicomponent Na+:H+ antiporter subunit A